MINTQFTRPILRHFGLPSPLPTYYSAQHELYQEELESAIDENQMVALVGERGSGKTTLFRMAAASLQLRDRSKYLFARVRNRDLEKLRVGHILTDVIGQVSTEDVRRDAAARTTQFLRVVGEQAVTNGRRVCVVFEEAHGLRPDILMSLKSLREEGFGPSEGPLFSVVMIGHPQFKGRLQQREEVHWRTLTLELREEAGWMTRPERVAYLDHRFGAAIDERTRRQLAARCTVPLQLDYAVAQAMREALAAGLDVVDHRTVRLSLEDRMAALQVSFPQLAAEAGVSQGSVSNVKSGTAGAEVTDKVLAALDRLEAADTAPSTRARKAA